MPQLPDAECLCLCVCPCSPAIFQADFAGSPAVKALAKDASAAPVYGLFAATLSGDLGSEWGSMQGWENLSSLKCQPHKGNPRE